MLYEEYREFLTIPTSVGSFNFNFSVSPAGTNTNMFQRGYDSTINPAKFKEFAEKHSQVCLISTEIVHSKVKRAYIYNIFFY